NGIAPGIGTEHDLDAPHQRAHALHVEVRRRAAQVAHETPEKPRTVLSLERELLIVDDDRIHRNQSSAAFAAACPLTTALSIVAGSPVSIQSPARKSPGTA